MLFPELLLTPLKSLQQCWERSCRHDHSPRWPCWLAPCSVADTLAALLLTALASIPFLVFILLGPEASAHFTLYRPLGIFADGVSWLLIAGILNILTG